MDVFAYLCTQAAARQELKKIDVLMVPTAAYNYTVQEIAEEEEQQHNSGKLPSRNANLGRMTNFCNLLDMCGVSVWSGVLRVTHGLFICVCTFGVIIGTGILYSGTTGKGAGAGRWQC